MNILMLSAGTRNLLVSYFLESGFDQVVAVDASHLAPALYTASRHYFVPPMSDPGYLTIIENICREERIDAILPLREDELDLFARKRDQFEKQGIKVIVSPLSTVRLCRDKYAFYQFCKVHEIPVLLTYPSSNDVMKAIDHGEVSFPLFIKPRYGCGSINSFQAWSVEFIQSVEKNYEEEFIIQEFNNGKEYGIDIYCDLISGDISDIFIKEKLRMRAGETEKSRAVIIPDLFDLVEKVMAILPCRGPVDMDVFEIDGKFFVSEINPRFGGGYPHAYLSGVNFPGNICNNVMNRANPETRGSYEEGTIGMKTQSMMVRSEKEKQ